MRPFSDRASTRCPASAVALLALVVLVGGCEGDEEAAPVMLSPESGSFIFQGSPAAADRPIRVWFHVPEGVRSDARVVFAMHGSGGTVRPGRSTLEGWMPLADRHGLVVVAPEFPWAFYPSHADYHWGGMHTPEGEAVPPEYWAFRTVADLFDDIIERFGLQTRFYTLYGHSAGAQFVHRMSMFLPDPRIDLYVAANPGNYTMPSLEWEYPYGLEGGGLQDDEGVEAFLEAAFSRRKLVLLGDADTSRVLSAANMRPEALAQGAHRVERAERFFQVAKDEAESLDIPLAWELRFVPDIAHNNAGMAAGTVRALGW